MTFSALIRDFVVAFWDSLVCWEVLEPYQGGVVLRMGKFNRALHMGLNWKWPLFEKVLTINTTPTSYNFYPAVTQTKDGTTVIFAPTAIYEIRDVKRALLEVEGVGTIINDCLYGFTREVIAQCTDAEVFAPEFSTKVLKELRKRGFKWGVEITTFAFGTLAKTSLRNGIIYVASNEKAVLA